MLLPILIAALQFTTVTLLVWVLFRYPARAEPPVHRHIAIAMGLETRRTIFEQPVIGQLMGLAVRLARRFHLFRTRIRRDLDASGNPNGYSVDEYLAICLAAGIALAVIATLLIGQLGQFDFLVLLAAPAAGFAAPLWTLHEAAASRTRNIARKLPYSLDLIALLMEAGAGFNEAVETLIADEPDDHLNQELRIVRSEVDFGATRSAALHHMAQRIPLESLRSVVGAINQAEMLGTPLAAILKTQSSMIRQMRSVAAEEASASASMRILIPSMLILAAVVLIVFAPLILRWTEGRLLDL